MSLTSWLGLRPQGLGCHLGRSLNMDCVFPLNINKAFNEYKSVHLGFLENLQRCTDISTHIAAYKTHVKCLETPYT